MPLKDVAPIEAVAEIDATPAAVWALVSDLRNMARWSPQCVKTIVRGGGAVGLGTRTLNINRRGLLMWPTRAKVIRFEPEQEIAFRVKDNLTVWSYRLEPNATGGTRVTARREAPDGIADVSVRLTKVAFGGVDRFSAELAEGLAHTLQQIKTEVEGSRAAA